MYARRMTTWKVLIERMLFEPQSYIANIVYATPQWWLGQVIDTLTQPSTA